MHKETAQKLLKDYGSAVLIAIGVALVIRFFFFEAYQIPSNAMKPTLEAGDAILVSKFPFGFRLPWSATPLTRGRMPHYGEIVIFSHPSEPNIDYIKRVVALAGDTLELRQGKLLLNGVARTQDPTANEATTPLLCGTETLPLSATAPLPSYTICREPPLLDDFGPVQVPEGSVFVLGDLRSKPETIRKQKSWGIIPASSIKAKAVGVWLSIEPPSKSAGTNWFSRIRFERMFRQIH